MSNWQDQAPLDVVPTVAYCVESRHVNDRGEGATARFYTADKAHAENVAAAAPGRVLKTLIGNEIPPKVRANIERAAAEGHS